MTETEVKQQTARYYEIEELHIIKDREDFEEQEQIAVRLMSVWSKRQSIYPYTLPFM